MPAVAISGKYLGGKVRQYDKKDGTRGVGGAFYLWDEEGQESVELRPDREMAFGAVQQLFEGLKFADPVTVNVDIRVWDNKAAYTVLSVVRPAKA